MPIGIFKISPGLGTAVLKEGKGLGEHPFPPSGVALPHLLAHAGDQPLLE